MRRAAGLLAALAAIGCASGSPVALTRTADVAGVTGRLHVPELFEPLAPGSAYPNRRAPIAAASRPAVLVWPEGETSRGLGRLAVRFLSERGVVVLELPEGTAGPYRERLSEGVRALGAFRESRGGRVGLLALSPSPPLALAALEEPSVAAVALVGFDPPDAPPAAAARRPPLLVSNLAAPLDPAAGLTARLTAFLGRQPVEKLYRPSRDGRGFPPEAARDAAEWLAEALAGE